VTQQTATFWVWGHRGGSTDPQIRTRARFLHKCQVSLSYINCSEVNRVDKQTNRGRWRIHLAPLCYAGG